MADRRETHARLAMTIAALTATVGGWIAFTLEDPPAAAPVPSEETLLEPIPPSLSRTEAVETPPPRRPRPVATTQSSR